MQRRSVFTVLIFLMTFFLPQILLCQIHKPVKWKFRTIAGAGNEATLRITATLESGWHIYSQFMEGGGPLPTTFHFSASEHYAAVGKTEEHGTPVRKYDDAFMMEIVLFSDSVVFTQKIRLKSPLVTIRGRVAFMACTDEMCLPAEEIRFSIPVSHRPSPEPGRSRERNERSHPETPGTADIGGTGTGFRQGFRLISRSQQIFRGRTG